MEQPPHSVVTSLTVTVLTYRRPRDIAAVLPLLADQAREVAAEGVATRVLVVDNDPEGGAADLVAGFAADSPVEVRYVHERTPGIAAARNRALDVCEDDLLVLIDDDERPTPHWLSRLLGCYRSHRAAAVAGPVVSEYEAEPAAWITDGGFFDRRRLPTGTPIDVAATNNLLLDMRAIRALGLRFDLAFGLTGGSDSMFTKELRRRGGAMVWCDEAVVVDVVPTHRLTRRWVVLRALRNGNSWSLTSVKIEDAPWRRGLTRLRLTGQGTVRLAGGLARWVAGCVTRSRPLNARGVRTMARGSGMVLGAWGYSYAEYRRRAA